MENGQAVIEVKDDQQYKGAINSLVSSADSLEITNDFAQDEAARLGKDLKKWVEDAEAYFEPEISAAFKLHRSLTAKRNSVVQPVKDAIVRLGQRLGIYQGEARRKQAEAEEKERARAAEAEKKEQEKLLNKAAEADLKGNTEKAEDLLNKAEEVYVAPRPVAPAYKPQGTVLNFSVDVVVKDMQLIPLEFLVVDEAKLKRRFKESKYSLAVPGVTFIKTPISSFRG